MTGKTVDYGSRQIDIELLQHIEDPRNQRVFPAANHDGMGPRVATGMEKVVQRYAKLFLTTKGSIRFDPHTGGTILSDMRAGKVQSLTYLTFIANMANSAAVREMQRDDSDERFGPQPDDEKLVSATIVNLELDDRAATVRIHVLLVTEAGSSYSFVVPVRSGVYE